MKELSIFIAGVALGLFICRVIIQISCGTSYLTMCDVCRHKREKTAVGAAV